MRVLVLLTCVALAAAEGYDTKDSYGHGDVGYGHQDNSYGYGHQDNSYGYDDKNSYGHQDNSYGHQDNSYGHQDNSYGHQDNSYGHQDNSYGYDNKQSYGYQDNSYGHDDKNSYGYQDNSYGYDSKNSYGGQSGYGGGYGGHQSGGYGGGGDHGSGYGKQQYGYLAFKHPYGPNRYEPDKYAAQGGKLVAYGGQCKDKGYALLPDKDCKYYHQCSNGYDYLMPCPYGLAFSSKYQRCVYPAHADCGGKGYA